MRTEAYKLFGLDVTRIPGLNELAVHLNLRRRLQMGAKVEQGKWIIDEMGADAIESYECPGLGENCGLNFREAEEEEATATATA